MPRLPSLFRNGIFEDIAALIGVALAIAFLASLENSLMAKSLASRTGDRIDVNQDMFSVGMANVATAFGGGMPASASLTRSALNFEAGATTRFSAMMAGMLTLSAAILIAWLGVWGVPLIDFIPRAALAALVVGIALTLFNKRHIRICLKSTPDDQRVLIITFISTLLAPLDVAIFIGVAVSVAFFLRRASRPSLVEYEFSDEGELREKSLKNARPIPSISIVHVEGDLFFGAADMFRNQVEHAVEDPNLKVIILRMKNARHLDATSAMALEDFIRNTRQRGVFVLVSGVSKALYKVLKNSGILETIQEGADRKDGESNLFVQFPSNPNLSTRDALRRAQQLLGEEKADIRIFHNPKPESPVS
jgi:sulfate permease, SulP family